MWGEAVVSVSPSGEPITLGEAQTQCRAESSDFEAELNLLIAAARAHVEQYTGTRIITQTVTLKRAKFASTMLLPVGKVASVTSITYRDSAGDTQTLSTDVYSLKGAGTLRAWIELNSGQSWPSVYDDSEAITLTAVVGGDEPDPAIKQAMLLLIGQWFDNRSAANVGNIVNEMPHAVEALLTNHRIYA